MVEHRQRFAETQCVALVPSFASQQPLLLDLRRLPEEVFASMRVWSAAWHVERGPKSLSLGDAEAKLYDKMHRYGVDDDGNARQYVSASDSAEYATFQSLHAKGLAELVPEVADHLILTKGRPIKCGAQVSFTKMQNNSK